MEFINSEISAKSFLDSYKPKVVAPVKRGQYMSLFFYKVSQEWNGAEPLQRKGLFGSRFGRIPDWELPVLYKLCEESKSFATFFWWKTKTMPPKKKIKKPKNLQFNLH
jgi:hypothetical protein